jgi:hypothetical protein
LGGIPFKFALFDINSTDLSKKKKDQGLVQLSLVEHALILMFVKKSK